MKQIENRVHPLHEFIEQLQTGKALLKDSPENVLEVVGILKSYGVVLDAYSQNLIYIADHQFLVFFPFFKYFNGKISLPQLFRHWWHDRINFEYAEYCMKTMMWHGGGGLDSYLDSPEFAHRAQAIISAKFKYNLGVLGINQLFPDFLIEQLRMSAYYSSLGQFWRVMADIFLSLSDLYDIGKITSIPQVVEHIKAGLVKDALKPITYQVKIGEQVYDIIPKSMGLTFLADTAIPYVEAVFFRGTPFLGTVSLNAQAYQVPPDQARFEYGALYADPLPIGGSGVPPTLLMHDMRHYLPEYLHQTYRRSLRGEDDLLVQICISFQKSMFCVTTAAILGLMPYAIDTEEPSEQTANLVYLEKWMDRFKTSRLLEANN
ncbi:carbon dioxide transporter [Cylindrospermopsis raciborskii S07]|uniref:Carbon dioxide transporter n=1 Tax=Cylindrospermopsis raciborskii CS-505 TaxID=533240 RepID=A0A853MHK3_9CYAN|nr:CO2 hydration protein [Cylindrospermopsis raciborskii]EFA70340.1 CO2 hydration [Cylindrospermopsis raciborskii CS-505]OBU77107.1 carbon dioxide transporter [Cylindrospermopsis raciborskii CS-505]OHY43346.1 carbon dioxide transporter [Cylindrospermopsis raciborskii CS-508]PNK03318.1 carbon dioxide transporter [Cylindrospermopsis raciborskii S14]PNK05126.1 carbon dioxide transporter [Cylindrospermopsis raciborskii S10]